MRCMERNKVTFFYAFYERKEAIVDDYGNTTGEFEVFYGKPLEYSANISAAKGETQTRQFGENEVYDKVIVADNFIPLINEYSVLWIDAMPQLDKTGALATDKSGKVITPYDYVVTKVARSLNGVSIAVSKVKVQ